ncbi:triose-phosphate isomerase [bacterium]|nr:triose-phosphate isomerase [bacterium]
MKKILAGNWKMHKTRSEVESFISSFSAQSNSETSIAIAPSPTLLETAVNAAKGTGIEIYSQNVSFENEGAWTGEISPLQLKDIGVTGSLVGHSERRTHFADTDETCAKRAAKAFEHGLKVIYCIGETLEEREAGQTEAVIKKQMAAAIPTLKNAKASDSNCAIAYEPVWAIGTGKVAGPEQVKEAHEWVQNELSSAGLNLPILYGGSVKPSNFGELSAIPHVAGALVGGASLKSDDFSALFEILR